MKIPYDKATLGTAELTHRYYLQYATEHVSDYLEEKGVDVMTDVLAPRYESDLHLPISLRSVPPKLYHEVVVPGVKSVCKLYKVRFLPQKYIRKPDGCWLWAWITLVPNDVPFEEMFDAVARE